MSAALQTDMDEAVNLVSADEATKNLLFNGTGANGDVTLTATNNTTDITFNFTKCNRNLSNYCRYKFRRDKCFGSQYEQWNKLNL